MKKHYYVDWGDAPYPKICSCDDEECEYHRHDGQHQSFSACKREMDDHARFEIEHWQMIRDRNRRLRKGQVGGET
jgi:hypothetical protein